MHFLNRDILPGFNHSKSFHCLDRQTYFYLGITVLVGFIKNSKNLLIILKGYLLRINVSKHAIFPERITCLHLAILGVI